MSDHQNDQNPTVGIHAAESENRTSKTRRATSRKTTGPSKPHLAQLTINVPREVLTSFDQFSADAGVVRAQLIREALELYAALLQSGHRTYQQPGMRRAG